MSILKERIIQIVSVQSPQSAMGPQSTSISAEFLGKKTQITVYNSDKMYNLLQTAMYKQKIKEEQRYFQPPQRQMVIGQLLKRSE